MMLLPSQLVSSFIENTYSVILLTDFKNSKTVITVYLISKTLDPKYGYSRHCAIIYNGVINQVGKKKNLK